MKITDEDPEEVSTDVEKESKREVYPYFVYVFFVSFSGPVRVDAALGLLYPCGSLVMTMEGAVMMRTRAMMKEKKKEEET